MRKARPGAILRTWRAASFELVTSEHILAELPATLRRPYFQRRITDEQLALPSGVSARYLRVMPYRHRRDVLMCGAVLWKRGNRCKNEAAPGAIYCPAHLSLLAPLEWVTGGYAAKLDPGTRPMFQSAAFATISEEVALARVQISALLQRNAPQRELLAAIRTVAELINLQHKIERAVLYRRTGRRSPATEDD
jgi:hypothetical protein